MSQKKNSKSRLNSTKIKTSLSKDLLIDDKNISKSTIGTESSDVYEKAYETDNYEYIEREDLEVQSASSRTSLLILDYMHFKAARVIQRFVRGWLCRTAYQRKRKAAIVIQAEWRRFHCQRKFYKKLEERAQQHIEEYFFRSAQKIQAVWRGWWVRKHVHDHTHLMHMQLTAGEDLLYCVAFKLHHLLRTHQIPGVYSLRNSTALSKVEKLLASLTFKNCNERTRRAKMYRQQEIEEAKKKHRNSKFATEIPFSGPNTNNHCVPMCRPFYNEKNIDLKMAKILQMYEAANRENRKSRTLEKKSSTLKKTKISSSFCGDVVDSLKKWRIISEKNLTVNSNVLQKPANVESFLKEMESKMTILQQ